MINEINLYAVDTIIEIGKAFEVEGWKLGSIFVKGVDDVKVSKGKLDIHGHDLSSTINEGTKTTVFVSIDNDEKYHRAWFKLVSYDEKKFSSWKMYQEEICYKD